MKKICIIMATYNGGHYLASQIESILANTYKDISLHIFDDCSSDNTFRIAKAYAEEYPDKIHAEKNQKNKGVVRNFLYATASLEADYYMYCDQDDIWLPGKIQKTLAFLQSCEKTTTPPYSTPVVVFSDAQVVDASLRELAPSFQRQSGYRTDALDLAHLLMENKLIGCTMMFNRAARDKLTHREFPDAVRMHDWWLALIGASFGKVAYLDEPLLMYRQHEKNVIGGNSRGSYFRDRISHLRSDRQALHATIEQGKAFLNVYGKELLPEQKKILRQFTELPEKNWIARRYSILHHGFLKSGLTRNLGILLLI